MLGQKAVLTMQSMAPVPARKKARLRLCAGFTLIEVMVAMVVFTIALLGLVASAVSIIKANQTSYFRTAGTTLAQDKLEELKAKASGGIASGSATDNVGGVAFTRTWTVIPDTPAPGVKRIDVKVEWTDYSPRSLTVSSAVKE